MVMAQVALGFRSLLTKAIVFFVMAALLAWALGGTLWPRAHVVNFPVHHAGGIDWWWRMTVGGRGGDVPQWIMMNKANGRNGVIAHPQFMELQFEEVAGPVVFGDAISFGGRLPKSHEQAGWRLYVNGPEGVPMPDRLAVEQQLARFQSGLEVQEYETILRQRRMVIDPADE